QVHGLRFTQRDPRVGAGLDNDLHQSPLEFGLVKRTWTSYRTNANRLVNSLRFARYIEPESRVVEITFSFDTSCLTRPARHARTSPSLAWNRDRNYRWVQ